MTDEIDCKLEANWEMAECAKDYDEHKEEHDGHGPSPMAANYQFFMMAGFAAVLQIFQQELQCTMFTDSHCRLILSDLNALLCSHAIDPISPSALRCPNKCGSRLR